MITPEQHLEIEARLERNRKPVRDGECLTCHGRRVIIPLGYGGTPVDCPTCVIPAATGVEDEIRDLHRPIIEFCRSKGWIYFYGNPTRKTGRTLGEVDFTCLLPFGVVIFVECKARANHLSPHQEAMSKRMKELGHEMHIVRTFGEFLTVCQVAMKVRPLEG